MDGPRIAVAFQTDRVGQRLHGLGDFGKNRHAAGGNGIVAGSEEGCFPHADYQSATFQLQPSAKDARATPLMAQSFTKSVLVGLGDASVRDVSAALSAETWNRAVHPSDGMVLGNDW